MTSCDIVQKLGADRRKLEGNVQSLKVVCMLAYVCMCKQTCAYIQWFVAVPVRC